MTANQFLHESGYNKVCTCSLKNSGRLYCNEDICKRIDPDDLPCTCGKVSFCPKSCENRIPDQDELLEELMQMCSILQIKNLGTGTVEKAITYIKATPLLVIDGTGRVFCTCEKKDSLNLSSRPDIAQAAQDADTEAQLIPVPSEKQCKVMGVPDLSKLLENASFEQRQEVEKVVPNFRDKVTRIVNILLRKV